MDLPLGSTVTAKGVLFCVYSLHAKSIELCIFEVDSDQELHRFCMFKVGNGLWSGNLAIKGERFKYGYRAYGPWNPEKGERFCHTRLLLDPYAKALDRCFSQVPAETHFRRNPFAFNCQDNAKSMAKAFVVNEHQDDFDWGPSGGPKYSWSKTVIYELHVKGFTATMNEVAPELRGKYLGLISGSSLRHLKSLGVTTLELMPVATFADEFFLQDHSLTNYWGYNTVAFFIPDSRYAVKDARREFKEMVRGLHQAEFEVILDIVLNHTAESDHQGPIWSFRGLDNQSYYRLMDGSGVYDNPAGTGNALNFSNPMVLRLALDCLRWWVQEYHVDGFRFDAAPVLAGRSHCECTAFFAAITQDPVLRSCKMIVEPWQVKCDGMTLGRFPAGFCEWNSYFRDSVAGFVLNQKSKSVAALADCLSGSSMFFNNKGRLPHSSINYIASHDGMTLLDMVSYKEKNNWKNCEGNRDGPTQFVSINCGVEGPSCDDRVVEKRSKLRRFLFSLLLSSRGTPMIHMGDEMGRSQDGNNNAWCQDNRTSWIHWEDADRELCGFVREMISFRLSRQLLHEDEWLEETTVQWLDRDGRHMTESGWSDPKIRCLAVHMMKGLSRQLLILINADEESQSFRICDEGFEVTFGSSVDWKKTNYDKRARKVLVEAHCLIFLESA